MLETASPNPLAIGVPEALLPQSCTLVIFEGGGDLSRWKLLPVLYNLYMVGVLPYNFAVVGLGHRELSDEAFHEFARDGGERFSRRRREMEQWEDVKRSLLFLSGSFDDTDTFVGLKQPLDEIEYKFGYLTSVFSIHRYPPI